MGHSQEEHAIFKFNLRSDFLLEKVVLSGGLVCLNFTGMFGNYDLVINMIAFRAFYLLTNNETYAVANISLLLVLFSKQ